MKRHLWLFGLIPAVAFTTLLVLPVVTNSSGRAVRKPQAAQVGEWTAPVDIGVVGIHATLLHTGKVLLYYYPINPAVKSPAVLYDPTSGTVTDVTPPFARDIYGSGVSILPDGRLLATGGMETSKPGPGAGIKNTTIFDPVTETWLDGPPMSFARWYPTNVQMPDGKTLVLSGMSEDAVTLQPAMEMYDPDSQMWTTLPPSANIQPNTDLYPRMVVVRNGKVLRAGTNRSTRVFTPVTNRWSIVATMNYGDRLRGGIVLLPGLQKVLTAGGSLTAKGDATATAEIMDVSVSNLKWSYTGSMNFPRKNLNLTLLADGSVLAVGGGRTAKYAAPVKQAEIFDPATGQWTVMAAQSAQRTYHSTALLLPDGRVLSAGSDDGTLASTIEIFSPPYLFKGRRPLISAAPNTISYSQPFTITTPDAAEITRVALIRSGATTHANNTEQRYVDVAFSVGSGELAVTAPRSGTGAPPGYYMLVIVNSSGVPSVMPFVRLQ
jgi:hypothetical protein